MTAHDYTTFAAPLAHPGEHLREDFLPDYDLTPGALARAMGLKDRTRIERLVREQQPVTSDTALRLARVFGTTAEFWMTSIAAALDSGMLQVFEYELPVEGHFRDFEARGDQFRQIVEALLEPQSSTGERG